MRSAKQSFQTSRKATPRSYTGTEPNVAFLLEVVQSPERARTCGFGSKDRRPLQPAAVARLHAMRTDTGVAIDPEEIDTTFFIAMTELWTPDRSTNVTMIADPTLPGAPRSARGPYAESAEGGDVVLSNPGQPYNLGVSPLMGPFSGISAHSQQMYTPNSTSSASFQGLDPVGTTYPLLVPSDPSFNPQGSFYPGYSVPLTADTKQSTPYTYASQAGPYDSSSQQMIVGPSSTNSPQAQPHFYPQPGSFGSNFGGLGFGQFPHMIMCPLKPIHLVGPVTHTSVVGPSRSARGSPTSSRSGTGSQASLPQVRSSQGGNQRESPPVNPSPALDVHNLLGPTFASASKLFDEKDRLGIFFVFQDLSVRTEGLFRLKVKLLCVAAYSAYEVTQQPSTILTEAWSGVFRVDPPKKFDGVPDSTPLSDAFHRQGVKISTRKQKSLPTRKRGRDFEYASGDDDEDDDD